MDPNGPPPSGSIPPFAMGKANFPPMGMSPMGVFPPHMGQDPSGNAPVVHFNAMAGKGFPPMGMHPGPHGMAGMPFMGLVEQNEKKKEFARGVYVSGLERTITLPMLLEHFKIKPVHAMKMPSSKFDENKGFAFIYYGSADDAAEVKKKLDYSVILRNTIRVTRIVIADNLSKMMFKLKTKDIKADEVEEVKNRYFNGQNLEREVDRIIRPLFHDSIEINKIAIPLSKKDDKTPLNYARVFFYVSNLKEASRIAKNLRDPSADLDGGDKAEKNEYEIVLNFISEKLNQNEDFKKYVKAEIYEYSKRNQSNILHFKGLKNKEGEKPENLAEELREFVQNQCKQSTVVGSFASINPKFGGWANVTFSTYEETVAAYELFKNQRVKFRDALLYANIRNVKDLRTVVISAVKDDANEKELHSFLTELAANSTRVEANDESKGRKYDFFSFNIIEQKSFYLDSESKSVSVQDEAEAQEHWRFNNSVPRRLVIHFLNEIKEEEIKDLIRDIKLSKDWSKFFFEKDAKSPIRANHQKGHIKGQVYQKHIDLKGKVKKVRSPQVPRDRANNLARLPRNDQARKPLPINPTAPGTDLSQFRITKGNTGGVPKTNQPGKTSQGGMPPMGRPVNYKPAGMPMGMGKPPMGMPLGGRPPMGQPPMGQPPMGQPSMGQPPMGQPPMGQPPMGQFARPAYMNQPPMMGQQPPMMGQQPPMMGQQPPMMGQQPPRQ